MMSSFRIGKTISRVIVVAYIAATLLLRFFLEEQLNGNFFISVAIGAFMLLFLWALVKSKILNPEWF